MARADTEKARKLRAEIKEQALSLELAQLKRRTIRMGYDAVDNEAKKRRRTPAVERQGEPGIYDRHKQQHAENLARDLVRNYTVATGQDLQRRLNVAGFATLSLDFDSEEHADVGAAIADWFNLDWAPESDARDETPFAEQLQCTITALGTDGGVLVAFDDTLQDDGKLWYWEIEQLCEVVDLAWRQEAPDFCRDGNGDPYPIDRGQIRDHAGRIVAYCVTWKRNAGMVNSGEYTIWARENARLIKRPKRHNQFIPVPLYLAGVSDMEDAYEMRTSELQSAKKAAKIYATIKSERKEDELDLNEDGAFVSQDDPALDADAASYMKAPHLEALEDLTGGYSDYIDDDDVVDVHAFDRPNGAMPGFLDHCSKNAGAAIGLADSYALMQAKASYTAFRGEVIMTWVAFYAEQYSLRERFLNWCAIKAIRYGLRRGLIEDDTGRKIRETDLPRNWHRRVEWAMPTAPVVDEEKHHRAQREGQKVGAVDFRDLHGSQWRRRMDRLAQQIAVAREKGLPYSVFETVAGAPLELDENEQTGTEDTGNE